jgi:hypothetical protein
MSESPLTTWQKWRRRIRRTIYTLLIIALIFRIILFFALAPVLSKVAGAYGFTASYDRQELTLLGGDVGLWGLKITPTAGGPPLLSADYVRGNISPLALLEGRLYVRRAEVDGSEITIDRTPDGRIPLLEHLVSNNTSPVPSTPSVQSGPLNLDFNPTLTVEAFRLSHVRAKVMDEMVQPPFVSTVAMDIRVSNFGMRDVPTSFEIDSWSDPALDLLRLAGESQASGQTLHAHATLTMRGFHPRYIAGYLLPLGIRPVGSNLTGDLYADLTIQPAAKPDVGMALSLNLQNIGLWTQDQPSISVNNFAIAANAVTPQKILLNSVQIDGVRVNINRDSASGVQLAGFGLTAALPSTRPTQPAPAAASTPSAFGLDLRNFAIDDVDFAFHDSTTYPVNELHLTIPQITAKPDPATNTLPIIGSMSIPGVISGVTFTGQANTASENMTVSVRAHGIRPDGLKTYLAAGGYDSLWNDGKLAADFSADLRSDPQGDLLADANCGPITLGDGNNLFTFKDLSIQGAGIDSQSGRLKIESVELSGPDLHIDRDSAGRVTVANIRWTPPQEPPPAPPPAPAASSSIGTIGLPRIEIGRFLWHEPNIVFHDELSDPHSDFSLTDAGLDIKNFRFDLDASDAPEDGTIQAWLKCQSPLMDLSVAGATHSTRDLFHMDLAVRGSNLHLTDLAPFGRTVGFEPTIQNGSFQLDASAEVARKNNVAAASLNVQNVSFKDGTTELAGLDSLHIGGVHCDDTGEDVQGIAVASPRISAGRDPDGSFRLAGIRLLPTDQPQAPSNFSFPQAVGLLDLHVTNAQINWNDQATPIPINAVVRTDFRLHGMQRDPSAPPATFQLKEQIDGTIDDITVSGTIDAHPEHPRLTANLSISGLKGKIISYYLPVGDRWAMLAGRLKLAMEAESPVNPDGGRSVNVNVHDLDFRDGPNGAPVLTMASAKFLAPRIDPAGGVIAIDQISLDGLKSEAQLDLQKHLDLLGISIGNAPTQTPPATLPATRPKRPSTPLASLAKLISKPQQNVPHITVQNFDLNIERIDLKDLSQPTAVPIALEHVRLHNPQPIDLGGAILYSQPTAVQLTGSITPIVGQFTVNLTATPFQQQPVLTADLSVSGIHGQGVTDVAPQLRSLLDGSQMTDGRFIATAKATFDYSRRGPNDFDISRGLKINGYIRKVEMRDRPEGPVLAGLAAIYLQDATERPATGSLIIKEISVQTPQAYIYRDAAGIHVCGIAFRSAAQPPSSAPVPAPPPAPAPTPPVAASANPNPSGEIRIENLLVGGLNVRIEDRLANPVFVAPLTGLDMDIRDLTTRATTEPKLIRFSALLSAGKVPIYKAKGSNLLVTDQRPLFSQASAVGKISLYPQPDGFIRLSLNGLELTALQAVALEYGVQLRSGLFDADVDLRPRGDSNIDTNCKLVLTDLQVSEPANGPISKSLRLPVPLDAAIVALQAPDGSITIPVSFTLKNGQVSESAIVGGAIGATGPIIATAVASAPLKLAGGVVGIFGIGGHSKTPRSETYEVAFDPGSAEMGPDDLALVQSLVLLAHRDPDLQFNIRQELGAADVQLAAQRANPTEADALALIQQLRQQRLELSFERARLAGLLRGQLSAISDQNADQTVLQLRGVEAQIANIEIACDELYDLLRPGAVRLAGRRTRGAAMEIAQRRLDEIDIFFRQSLSSYNQRVRVVTPQYTQPTLPDGGRVLITIIYAK